MIIKMKLINQTNKHCNDGKEQNNEFSARGKETEKTNTPQTLRAVSSVCHDVLSMQMPTTDWLTLDDHQQFTYSVNVSSLTLFAHLS